jgi:NAD(P)-dependent dehydrogenase (short-subunit alcohol dehydrogenase family)
MARTLLVTGGSGGIGAATARRAAHRGYDVAIHYSANAAAAEAVAGDVRAAGRRAITLRADVAHSGQIRSMFTEFDSQFGRLDAFFNNAGILFAGTRFMDIGEEQLDRIIAVNLKGAYIAAQEAARRLARSRGGNGGSIVNMSSMLAKLGGGLENNDYGATKAAIEAMTIGMAKELAADGVRVNAVRPGLIDTQIHARAGDPGRVDRLMASVPLGRAGSPEDVAEAVLWLLSDQSAYTTGTIIDVAGGRGI